MLWTGITIEPRSQRLLVEPFLDEPVVQRAAECVGHVLGEHHLDAVQGIADAVSGSERIERLLFMSSRLEPGLPCEGRQSGREVIGEFIG